MQKTALNDNMNPVIDFENNIDTEITVKGMIQNLRIAKWGGFIILRLPLYTIQAVIDRNTINITPEDLRVESCIKMTGTVKTTTIKDKSINPANYELHVTHIEIISTPSVTSQPVDTTKKEINVNLDTKFDYRQLTLRHPKERAVFKIASVINNEFSNFLNSQGFTKINSPKLVATGAEGGANIFQIDYFGRKAFLAQSPQFYKQMMVGVFGRVYETAPVFRAEKHDTSRHLNEYISLDFEMMLDNDYFDLIKMESLLLNHIISSVETQCSKEVDLLGIELPSKIDEIISIPFDDVHQIIFEKYKKDFRGEKDLAPEEEALISEYVKKETGSDFVFVTNYPSIKRPFYTMDDPDNNERTLSFDLIFKGMEITTGGQRLHKYEDYITKMKNLGMDTKDFTEYLETFQYGMPPHGGLGLGLERLTALICGLHNVKEASLFPRDINRLKP